MMSNFYKCTNFKPEELVDKQTFERFKGNIWFLFRQDALISLDGIRNYFKKPVIVNNWREGGSFKFRGLRPHESPVWTQYSQHSFGNAFDLDVVGMKADEVRKEIINNKDDDHFDLITCLEIGINWVHFDCRNISERILLVKP